MTGLIIDFTVSPPRLKLEENTESAAAVQNACVVFVTTAGTDRAFPDKGTGILKFATAGAIFDRQSAEHACNFAAVETLTFVQESANNPLLDADIVDISARPAQIADQRMHVQLSMRNAGGQIFGPSL